MINVDLFADQTTELQDRLACLDAKRAELVAELRGHREKIGEINLHSQRIGEELSRCQVAHLQALRSELQQQLMEVQAEIGGANRRLRELRALGQAPQDERQLANDAQPVASQPLTKVYRHRPATEHPKFSEYFLLAARDGLPSRDFRKLEKTAGMLLHQAVTTGLEADNDGEGGQ